VNVRAEVKPLARPPHVLVVALGGVPHKLAHAAGESLQEMLDVAAKLGPSLDRPQYAFNEGRKQYHATAILRRLGSLGAHGAPVVGVLDGDLFLPDAPYVIADADRDAGAAVFSLARLAHADPDKVKRRAQVETVHGAGHLLGLSHCADFRCAMFFSRDAADSDRKGPGLCVSCREALGLAPRP
jgi:archaemetzincin